MLLTVTAVLGALVAFLLYRRSRTAEPEVTRESTPALDRFVRDALEDELAEHVLGTRRSTPAERRRLARTLADEPDVDVVGKIEELVRAVELEFVRYAHEGEVEVTVRVRYEDGAVGAATRRLPLSDIPRGIGADFDTRASTRVFRTWAFPWQRVHAL